jgi:hypothetical protein
MTDVNTSASGLLVPEGSINIVEIVSAQLWFSRYIYVCLPEICLLGTIIPIYATAGDKYVRIITILTVVSYFDL